MAKRTTKWYRKNEAEVMQRLGFKPTRNSGATWIDKGDGQNEHCICELKSTDNASYRLEQTTLHTLEANAIEAHKLPVFALQFLNVDEVWLAVKETDIEAFKQLVRASVLEELIDNANFYDVKKDLQKNIDKIKGKSYNKGEGVGVEDLEVFDFMPQTNANIDTDRVKKNMLARNKYKLDREKQSIKYEEEQKRKKKERTRNWQKRNSNKKE
jgi:hypothetical protein|nr:MAG TPA: hypothetical protein [Caudoviricetes sp.]